jgi:formiminotetrahydrofolate cyclodeaminase
MPISKQTLTDFVRDLAATSPAPGSGAAGAIALALAAGCAAKAFAISHLHNGHPALQAAADRARTISNSALQGAQRDGDDFQALLKTHAPSAASSLEQGAAVLFSLAAELDDLITQHTTDVIPSLLPDLASAKDLSAAFRAIEARNEAELAKTRPQPQPPR